MTSTEPATDNESAVAIIGMAGRFPGASSVEGLWHNLTEGISGLQTFSVQELKEAGVPTGTIADPRYVRVGGALKNIDLFDAGVFGINPREASLMDPQHRMFLECSWEALEAAGYCPTDVPGQVGVFAGCGFPDYIVENLAHLIDDPGTGLLMAVGNERDSLASLVSYKLGLRGPAIGVQTFCSTSLVSVHLACQSLLTYECDAAIAGGAFVPLPQPSGYHYVQGGILSPDGIVRSFDAGANGAVMGSGVGTVALKRLTDAIADGDPVRAVILGSAANNDGRVRAGYTAPGVDGEADVIDIALRVADVKPSTIGYVECHATGTSLGDAIELAALNRVFAQDRDTPCVLSSLKPTLGHLDRASGVAGLIRATLNVEKAVLPRTLNYHTPNPALADVTERFAVLRADAPWPAGPLPRRAGVSSFGLGGTNAHVVLQQAPDTPAAPPSTEPQLLVLSALDEGALDAATENLLTHLLTHPQDEIADVAFTLQQSRGGFPLRRVIACRDAADAVTALRDPSRWVQGRTTRRNPALDLAVNESRTPAWWQAVGAAIGAGPQHADLTGISGWLRKIGVRMDPAAAADTIGDIDGDVRIQDGQGDLWPLGVLGQAFIAGATVNWAALHPTPRRRVVLPTYPFQRRRYWVDPVPKATTEPAGRSFDRSTWTYQPTWTQQPVTVTGIGPVAAQAGPWLVLTDDARGEAIADRLLELGAQVSVIRSTDNPAPGTDSRVRADSTEDLTAAIADLPTPPEFVIHAFSLGGSSAPIGTGPGHFHAAQGRGLYSVMALAAALIDDTGEAPRTTIVVLTSGAAGVVGSDLTHPEHAAVAALVPTLAQENPRVLSRHVDIDAPAAGGLSALADQVIAGLLTPHSGPVAIREGESWLRSYRHHPTADVQTPAVGPGDTVLITGGLGDVGRLISGRFASLGCNLVLTVRTPLPPREQWQQHLQATPAGRAARHISSILELEQAGAQVLAISADVAERPAMQAVVDAAITRFGRIDVVVHGAGVQDAAHFGFVHQMERASVQAHLEAKIDGFHILDSVLGDQARNRRITLSSLAAVLGGMTLGPYAAANAGMDAYARVARAAGRGKWISVDWDTWNIDPARVAGHSTDITDFAMAPAEGLDLVDRALLAGVDVPQLVISTGSLAARLDRWVLTDLHADRDAEGDDQSRHPRPELSTPFVAPNGKSEQKLAEIWGQALGIDPIGSADNFFELGGNSLIAIDLTHRIRRAFRAPIPVTGLLESPTIAALAIVIDTLGAGDE